MKMVSSCHRFSHSARRGWRDMVCSWLRMGRLSSFGLGEMQFHNSFRTFLICLVTKFLGEARYTLYPIRLQREHTDLLGFIDYITCTRQPVQSAGKCCHPKDKGDASWSILPPTICCKRRRRAAAKTMGPQLTHPRSCGHITKLPTVHLTVEGQGMAST